MKKLLAYLCFMLPFSIAAAQPTFGGNMPALRSTHLREDAPQFDLALSYLHPGDVARASCLSWEVLWDPKGTYDFRGIDMAMRKMAAKGVTPIWILQPTPYPTSLWYSTPWNDWFMPRRDLWPDIVKMDTTIALHIVSETQKISSIAPIFQLWNEPEGGKPGGSVTSVNGEWCPDLHELLFYLVKDLRANGIPKSQIIGPAISSFGESKRSETAEMMSAMPPPQFDWLSECGYRAYHIRLMAGWAHGDLTQVAAGFKASLDWVNWLNGRMKWPADQKIMVTEFYVTPGDVGLPIGVDMYPYHKAAFEALKASNFTSVVGWGLRPVETDNPLDPFTVYGGLGTSLVKWRAGL